MWTFSSFQRQLDLTSSPVSVVEKSRINPLPDIPERTFGIKDPPEEKKGYYMIYKHSFIQLGTE